MQRYIKNIIRLSLVSLTAFLVGCSGCVSRAGDKVTGAGAATINTVTGLVTGSGSGTSISQVHGTHSGTIDNGSRTIKMADTSDKIVCTNSTTGVITVYSQGSTLNVSNTGACVDTPANQVSANAGQTPTTSGSGSAGSGSPTTSEQIALKMKNSF